MPARSVLPIVFYVLLTWPALAQEAPGDPDAGVAAPAQSIAVEPVARDAEIEQRIRKILAATGWYEDARVAVNDGVVFLDGHTRRAEHRQWARDLALKTQDVVAVVNRIAVEPTVHWTFEPALLEIRSLIQAGAAALPLIVLALIILPLAWYATVWVAAFARRLLTGRIRSPHLRNMVARGIAVPVFLLGLYIVLQVAGLTQLALSVVGGASLIGIVFGLAFRDIAENFLASLLLSIRNPFRGGDLIEVDGMQGTVLSMNTRCTVLLSPDGNHIQIPNAGIFKSRIVNYSAAPARRECFDVGIGYDDSIADAQEVVGAVLRDHPAVIDDPSPLVLVESLGAATVNLRVYFWFDGDVYSPIKVQSALLRLTKRALTENGISMPDEAREIIFPQGVPVVGLDGAGRSAPAGAAPPPEAPAAESAASATSAEGGLDNEQDRIEAQAASAVIPEDDTDLLVDKS
ncbi:MAG: mechanosensitive ion channel family protein [Gammaproteobacteria bacterium]